MPSPEGSKTFRLYYNEHEPKPVLNQYEMKVIINRFAKYLDYLPDKALKTLQDAIKSDDKELWKALPKWGEIDEDS